MASPETTRLSATAWSSAKPTRSRQLHEPVRARIEQYQSQGQWVARDFGKLRLQFTAPALRRRECTSLRALLTRPRRRKALRALSPRRRARISRAHASVSAPRSPKIGMAAQLEKWAAAWHGRLPWAEFCSVSRQARRFRGPIRYRRSQRGCFDALCFDDGQDNDRQTSGFTGRPNAFPSRSTTPHKVIPQQTPWRQNVPA